MRARISILPLLLLAACGGGSGDGDDDSPIDAPPEIDAPYDPSVVETRDVAIGVTGVGPGQEATVCIVVDLGNVEPRMIRAVRSRLTSGTHHVIATMSEAAPIPSVQPCGPFAGGGGDSGVLTIGQQSESSLTYPAGAGVPIHAHQSIHLEMHYINTGDAPQDISGTVFLDLAATGDLAPIQFVFTGNPGFTIPAGQPLTIESFHTLPAGSRLFATTAHTHKLGLRATVVLDPPGTMLHDSTNWAERPLDNFEPITIAEGQGLRLTCNFLNTTSQSVGFGTSAEDEMCFVWAHLVAP
jgi:hypothetical protein